MNNGNGRKIFYGVVGVATLVVAVIGATFAYFTASASANASINGNFATISFSLNVTKVTRAGDASGLIPMTNGQVDTAVSTANTTANDGICMDDNGNAVCQIYKIVVTNSSTATMMVDGYVTISGGPAATADYAAATTGMRWAQVFCNGEDNALTGCTTNGTVDLGVNDTLTTDNVSIEALATTTSTLHNTDKIMTTKAAIKGSATIDGNSYETVGKNFIRVSTRTAASGYTREGDATSALVWSQQLGPANASATTDEATYYIVVWLSESGTAQNTAGEAPTPFVGSVTFNSAEGSEVTATFSSSAKVTPSSGNATPTNPTPGEDETETPTET